MAQRPIYNSNIAPYDERIIIIKNKIKQVIPYKYSLESAGNIKKRIKIDANAYAHGGTGKGDRGIDSKKIVIGFDIFEKTEEEHDKIYNELLALFNQDDYYLITGRNDRQYHVTGLEQTKQKYYPGFKQRWSEISFTLLLADPFRYATQATVRKVKYEAKQTNTLLNFHSKGNIDTPLIITFAPLETMADIQITHLENNRTCTIRDNLLTAPAKLTISTVDGTVRRDTFNAINAFSGQFLTVLPGTNNYLISCDAGEVTIIYTDRWLI